MRFAVRLPYPEQEDSLWSEAVRELEPVGWVEVAFVNPVLFEKVSLDEVAGPFEDSRDVAAAAIHMAHARAVERSQFERTLRRTIDLADRLRTRHIIAHPNRGRLSDVLRFLEDEITPLLEAKDKLLCWEVFEGRRRILHGLEDVVAFCRERRSFRACYDFSHVSGTQSEVEAEVTRHLEWIAHFHLSNRVRAGRIQHLPVFWNEQAGELGRDLDLLKILHLLAREGYQESVTLEYQPQFHAHLVPDALRLAEMFGV